MATPLKDRLARQASGLSSLSFDPTGRDEPKLTIIPLSLIDPDPEQPRRLLGDLTDLALSIGEHGIINPIVVEPVENGRYRILTGERRFAACRKLGLETAPCIVRTIEEQSRLAVQLIENMHRRELTPVEEAHAMRRLLEEFNLSQRDLAQRLGKSVGSVNQTLRILDLDPEVLSKVQTSEHTSKSLLLEIAKESDPQRQRELLQQAQEGQLTVRTARTGKTKPAQPRQASVTISLPNATVVVRFAEGELVPERVAEALTAAAEKFSSDRSDV